MLPVALLAALALVVLLVVQQQAQAGSESTPPGALPAPAPTDPTMPGPVLPGDPHDWDNQIVAAMNAVGIADPVAQVRLKAIIAHESGFVVNIAGDYTGAPAQYGPYGPGTCVDLNGNAVSSAGYCSLGLGQVNRCAHPQYEWGSGWVADVVGGDLLDPNDNILAAAQQFAACFNQVGGDLDAATRCYNGSGLTTYAYLANVKAVLASWGVPA